MIAHVLEHQVRIERVRSGAGLIVASRSAKGRSFAERKTTNPTVNTAPVLMSGGKHNLRLKSLVLVDGGDPHQASVDVDQRDLCLCDLCLDDCRN